MLFRVPEIGVFARVGVQIVDFSVVLVEMHGDLVSVVNLGLLRGTGWIDRIGSVEISTHLGAAIQIRCVHFGIQEPHGVPVLLVAANKQDIRFIHHVRPFHA